MTSTSISIHHRSRVASTQAIPHNYNWYSLTSCLLSLLFIAYLFIPKVPFVSGSSHLAMTFLFVFLAPIAAFILAIFSLRTESESNGGVIPSYIALSITSLYFMTALAIPFILVGCYILYAYIF